MDKIAKLTTIIQNLQVHARQINIPAADRLFINSLSFVEIAESLQELMEGGVGIDRLWLLWQRNKKILPDQTAKMRAELEDNHILVRILAEHELLLCFLADLEQVNDDIQELGFASSYTQQIRQLELIIGHIARQAQHSEREEDIIFPELQRRGHGDVLKILNSQHIELRYASENVRELAWNIDRIGFDEFKSKIDEAVHFIVPTMHIHIFVETNVIFPLALEVIHNDNVWKRLKVVCDMIGY